jgi:hypothetical protein
MTTPTNVLEAREARAAIRRHAHALLSSDEAADRELAAAVFDLLTAHTEAPGLLVAIVGAVIRPVLSTKGRRRFFDALGEEFRKKNGLRATVPQTAPKAAARLPRTARKAA